MLKFSACLHAMVAAAGVLVFACGSASASTIVKIDFNLGITEPDRFFNYVYLELFDDTPATRDNFLNYVNDGDYTNVIMHRLDPGFVLQGGGFTWNGSSFDPIPLDPPVVNEFGRSNLRGTLAMAKLGGNPDSATSQFFFNLNDDNSGNLDDQNGGFTVFARVLGDGMDLIDALSGISTFTVAGFTDVPLLGGTTFLRMTNVAVTPLRIGDTDLDGDIDQDDADLLTTTLVGGTDEPQFDVDENGTIDQADLDLLNALLLGDANGDGFVGIDDLNVILNAWNQTVPPGDPLADRNGDGFVGVDDLNAVLAAWNAGSQPPSVGAVVPEPATIGLVGFGVLVILLRRSA